VVINVQLIPQLGGIVAYVLVDGLAPLIQLVKRRIWTTVLKLDLQVLNCTQPELALEDGPG